LTLGWVGLGKVLVFGKILCGEGGFGDGFGF